MIDFTFARYKNARSVQKLSNGFQHHGKTGGEKSHQNKNIFMKLWAVV